MDNAIGKYMYINSSHNAKKITFLIIHLLIIANTINSLSIAVAKRFNGKKNICYLNSRYSYLLLRHAFMPTNAFEVEVPIMIQIYCKWRRSTSATNSVNFRLIIFTGFWYRFGRFKTLIVENTTEIFGN